MVGRAYPIAFVLVKVCVLFCAASYAASQSGDTLIVMSRSGSDAALFKERLERRGLRVLREVRCKTYGYSVFEVRPAADGADAALRALKSSKDRDLAAAERTFESHLQACDPDLTDPDYDLQWHLDAMHYDDMYCLLDSQSVKQAERPRITLIDSGIVAINKELSAGQIREFNFQGGANGVEETTFVDSASTFHGTAVTSVAASTTNNGKFLASPASFNKTAQITMCRVASPPDAVIDTLDVIDAMVWCVDNQAIRGGPGVINMSINAAPPATYNASTVVQKIARSAYRQGDLFVNGAGNSNQLDASAVKKQFRVVIGLDESNMRWVDSPSSGSVFGDFLAAAPCANIPTLAGQAKAVIAFHSGTSLASPCWASCIALLMSLDPALTAPDADKVVFKTATVTTEGYHLPNLYKAVRKVLNLRP